MRTRIAAAAKEIGVHPDTLRDLERRGVIPPAPRDWAGHRVYSEAAIKHLRAVLFAQREARRS
jgi:DNA-binding transcriptional MerR regulator